MFANLASKNASGRRKAFVRAAKGLSTTTNVFTAPYVDEMSRLDFACTAKRMIPA
jgi:hypothetical protein